MTDDFQNVDDWFDERMPLVAEQMRTAERVMKAVGHAVDLWLTPTDSKELAVLMCLRCEAQASIQCVTGVEGADYTVMLLPAGSCSHGE